MTHAFLIMLYLGKQLVSQDMYFKSIDDCLYYAERLNKQPSIPNRTAIEDAPKTVSYVAVCVPKLIDSKKTKIY
jgi:hypothetical protein